MRHKRDKGSIKISKWLFVFIFFLFFVICFQLVNLSLSETVNGVDLKKFASNRNTKKETLPAYRGNIYASNGEPLAQTIDSYTVIAYLDESRTKKIDSPRHVVDIEMTAEKLSPLLNMSTERLTSLLNRENTYQVELGPGGHDITELKKEAILKLELPGIDFIPTYRRYYPNHDFLSYTLGYVQKYEKQLVGEMGLELFYDDLLKGKDGYLEYQQDLNGYRLPHTPEIQKPAIDGADIYLTIDGNIQMLAERVVKETAQTYNPEWVLLVVADAETGKILATSSKPSFDPNIKDITSYLNPLVSYAYEPGSTMKIFTYMTALEKGTYKGEEVFYSGNKKIGEDTVYDWNNKGWGYINYDLGFSLSSNVGASYMMEQFINKNDLKEYLTLLGFGSKTGINLPGEVAGKINFNYKIEVANAAFGQGITITPIQFVQALTAIANDGVMLKPYIVDKIVDPNTNQIIYQGEREELRTVASYKTITKIKDLMYNVINLPSNETTGSAYKMEGYDLIGKTGTAQYVNPQTGKYYQDEHSYIRSFAGMFPKDNPKVIIYGAIKKPSFGTILSSVNMTKRMVNETAKYLQIFKTIENEEEELITSFKMPNLINKKTSAISTILSPYDNKLIMIGDGDKIIKQYPESDILVNNKDKIFIVTSNKKIMMPNMNKWSKREVITFCNLISLNCITNGYGYVINQSIDINTLINEDDELIVDLAIKIE